MEIVYDYPPNYEAIAEAFNIQDNEAVIFTYGNKLYIPAGERVRIDKPLMRHEETHARQQKRIGVEEWWDQFLADPAFRLQQELEAYREQYRNMAGMPLKERMAYLTHISRDLSGTMYGNLLTEEEAVKVITEGIILKHTRPTSSSLTARKLKKRMRLNRKKGRK